MIVKRNKKLTKKQIDTCVSELISWAYSRRLVYTDKPFTDTQSTKPFIDGTDLTITHDSNKSTDIHCYTIDLIKYITTKSDLPITIEDRCRFILEHITPILLLHDIHSISFGNMIYEINFDKTGYYHVYNR